MSNEISVIETTALKLYKSGLFSDVKSAEQAFVKILAGQELGIPAFSSMTSVYVIQGKTVLSSGLMASLIRKHGYDYNVVKHNIDMCAIEFIAKDKRSLGQSIFTITDARNASLLGKDNWKKYPRNMLFARAISNGIKFFCPDIMFGSVYTPDELDVCVDNDEIPACEGTIIDAASEELKEPEATVGSHQLIQPQDYEKLIENASTIDELKRIYTEAFSVYKGTEHAQLLFETKEKRKEALTNDNTV